MDWSKYCNTPEKVERYSIVSIIGSTISIIASIVGIVFCIKQIYDDKKLIEENGKQEE